MEIVPAGTTPPARRRILSASRPRGERLHGTPGHRPDRLRHRRRRRRPAAAGTARAPGRPRRPAAGAAPRRGPRPRQAAGRRAAARDCSPPTCSRCCAIRRSRSRSNWSAASTGRGRRCSTLLAAGKDVVTANKALLAQHGAEVFDAARRHGRAVAFEASVGRRRPDHRRPGAEPGRQPDPVAPGHPQRHLQLHPDRHERARPQLRRGAGRGPAARLRRGRPDPRRGRHRRRPQAGHPGPDRLRRRRAAVGHRPPRHRRHATPLDIRFAARAGLHHQAAGRGVAATASWPCTSRRCCCGTRRRWPRCAAPTTPSTSSATRSATRSITARAPGRCRPPAPSSPT